MPQSISSEKDSKLNYGGAKVFILEARSIIGQPSLYAIDSKLMCEVPPDRAMRMTHYQAKERAAFEKKLRPGRRIFIIKTEG